MTYIIAFIQYNLNFASVFIPSPNHLDIHPYRVSTHNSKSSLSSILENLGRVAIDIQSPSLSLSFDFTSYVPSLIYVSKFRGAYLYIVLENYLLEISFPCRIFQLFQNHLLIKPLYFPLWVIMISPVIFQSSDIPAKFL